MSEHSIKIRRASADPSRRRFLKTTLAGALLAGTLPLSEAQAAKASKSAANYRDRPNGNQKCSVCRFFVRPYSCQLVAGRISPNGWSKFFKPAG